MINIVELVADEQEASPCKWGNIVTGHACYCHKDDWTEGPRKCPIWRNFETPGPAWRKVPLVMESSPHSFSFRGGECVESDFRDVPVFPEDGGCPMFEPSK